MAPLDLEVHDAAEKTHSGNELQNVRTWTHRLHELCISVTQWDTRYHPTAAALPPTFAVPVCSWALYAVQGANQRRHGIPRPFHSRVLNLKRSVVIHASFLPTPSGQQGSPTAMPAGASSNKQVPRCLSLEELFQCFPGLAATIAGFLDQCSKKGLRMCSQTCKAAVDPVLTHVILLEDVERSLTLLQGPKWRHLQGLRLG